jgi:hypothetical protein
MSELTEEQRQALAERVVDGIRWLADLLNDMAARIAQREIERREAVRADAASTQDT